MPVFATEEKFILYVHVPKTGGSFVENFFHRNGFGIAYIDRGMRKPDFNEVRVVSPQHMHAEMLAWTFDLSKFSSIFLTVRHPLARLLSEYRMRLDTKEPIDFNEWFEDIYAQYLDDPFVNDNHIRPQHEFMVEGALVYRQEDKFDAKWADLVEKDLSVHFPKRVFSVSESSHRKKPFSRGTDAITKTNQDKILSLYERDFSMFGYDVPF